LLRLVAVRSRHMNSTCQTIALLGVLLLACPERARAQVSAPVPAEDTARLRSEIHKGDAEAIAKAGDSHNPIFIEDLKALQESLGTKGGNTRWLIRISLAKLGDINALQESYCRVESQYPLIKQNAIENNLTKIGGWFSISVLERQFEEDDRWRKAPRKYWKSVAPDVVLPPPSDLALMILPKLVKDPPLPSPLRVAAQESPEQAKIAVWKTWIDANSTVLRTLRPAGQDVNTSPTACSPFRAKEKEWLKEITH
jgi:hypothetical protein